jgi:hypothetical protein
LLGEEECALVCFQAQIELAARETQVATQRPDMCQAPRVGPGLALGTFERGQGFVVAIHDAQCSRQTEPCACTLSARHRQFDAAAIGGTCLAHSAHGEVDVTAHRMRLATMLWLASDLESTMHERHGAFELVREPACVRGPKIRRRGARVSSGSEVLGIQAGVALFVPGSGSPVQVAAARTEQRLVNSIANERVGETAFISSHGDQASLFERLDIEAWVGENVQQRALREMVAQDGRSVQCALQPGVEPLDARENQPPDRSRQCGLSRPCRAQ